MSDLHDYMVIDTNGTRTLYDNARLYFPDPDFVSIVYNGEKTALIPFNQISEIRIVSKKVTKYGE